MVFAKLAKISRVDNLFLESPSLYDSTFQPSPLNPPLHLFGANMKSLGQRVFREPILAHARIRTQPPKHTANRSRRAAEQEGHFMQGMRGYQVEQLLLLVVGPFPIRLLLSNAELAHESQASVPGVSGDFNQFRDE
jgi:hypothetical protein